jgi:hypothetical protein
MHVLARWGSPGRLRAFLRRIIGGVAATYVAVTIAVATVAAAVVGAVTVSVVANSPASAATGATATSSKVTTTSVLKAAKAAINGQSSAHVVFDASGSSSTAENIVGDVGTHGGTETVTDGAAVLTVKVTSTDSYISGTPTGLTTLFGLTSAEATKVGALWEFWKSGSAQYKSLMKVVSVHSLLTLLPKAKGTTLSTAGSVYTLTWNTAATSREPALSNVLTISAKGPKLPMAETSTDAAGEKVTTTLSMWGEKLHVQAPPSASTIASSAVSH